MDRRIVARVAGVAAFFGAAFLARHATEWLRREPPIPPALATRAWVSQAIGQSGLVVDLPWTLPSEPIELPPEVKKAVVTSTNLSREAEGITVSASHVAFAPDKAVSLDGAAKGAVDNLRNVPGTRAVDAPPPREIEVAGLRALEVSATVTRERGLPLQVHGVVLAQGSELIQLFLVARADQTLGPAVWERMRASVRRGAAAPAGPSAPA